MHLNEEVNKLKEDIKLSLRNSIIKDDPSMLKKTEKILERVESYRNREIDEEMLKEILKIQNLMEEIQSDAS